MIIYKKGNYSEPLRTKKADASCVDEWQFWSSR